MSTTKELIKTYNDLADKLGLKPLAGWKQAGSKLAEKIAELDLETASAASAVEVDTTAPDGAEATTDDPVTPGDAPKVIICDRFIPISMLNPDQEVYDITKFEAGIKLKATGPGIGNRVRAWLMEPEALGYDEIVRRVLAEFPGAKTSTRSIASVAAQMRREGIDLPKRTKGRKT